MRAIFAALALCWLVGGANAQTVPQPPTMPPPSEQAEVAPQAPRVNPGQGADDPVQTQENTERGPDHAANPPPAVPMVLPPGDHGKGQGQTQKPSEDASEFWTAFGVRLKQGEALLVAFTALLFLATTALWWATRNLVTETKRTARHQLRAYISYATRRPASVIVGNNFIATLLLENHGQTPARGVVPTVGIAIRKKNSPDPWVHNTTITGPSSVVHPRQTKVVTLFNEGIGGMEGFHAGTHDLYIFGRVTYKDIFGKQNFTAFRQVWGEEADGKPGWHFCDEGNDAS